MSLDAVQNKNNIYVDPAQNNADANRAEKAWFSPTSNTSSVENTEQSVDDVKQAQESAKQQMIDKAISDTIKGTGLTLDEVKKMFASFIDNKSSEFNKEALQKALNCLKYAIEDSRDVNGKFDKEKFQKIFGCYVLMTMTSDKKNVSCDDARKVMNMSLIQFVTANNPNLKNKKNITATDVKESLKIFVKKNFTQEKLQELANAPESAKSAIKSMFGMLLDNCKSDEINMLFTAFVMLLQDQDMVQYVPELIKGVCEHLKNDKTGRLQKFLNEDLDNILIKLGFSKDTIKKLKDLGLFESINADNIGDLLTGGLQFLQEINPDELTILIEALNILSQDGELSKEQINVLEKYKPQLDQLIAVIGKIANNPELLQGHEELFQKIQNLLGETGLGDYVFNGIQALFEQSPELFTNCTSKDDLIKILNKLTDNQYGKAVGDTNPENLCKDNSTNETSGFGMPQRTTEESFWSALTRQNNITQTINEANKNNQPEFFVLTNKKDKKSFAQLVSTPHDILLSVRTLSAKDLHEYLSNNDIKIDDILSSYKDLTSSAKLYVNKLIEIMSPAEQSFRLDGMANTETLEIIRHAHLNPEDLNLALDFASQKELEKMEEEKSAFSI